MTSCRKQMIARGDQWVPRSCPQCGIAKVCHMEATIVNPPAQPDALRLADLIMPPHITSSEGLPWYLRVMFDAAAELRRLHQREVSVSRFNLGDRVRKTKGGSWQGIVVGHYSTTLTPDGVAVESEREPGSVQIYPVTALEMVPQQAAQGGERVVNLDQITPEMEKAFQVAFVDQIHNRKHNRSGKAQVSAEVAGLRAMLAAAPAARAAQGERSTKCNE